MRVSSLKKFGINVTAQIPLTFENMTSKVIEKIFLNLHKHGIDKVLLMRIFPVGRGSITKFASPIINMYKRAIEKYQSMENAYKYPIIKAQTALQTLLSEKPEDSFSNYPSSHLVINQQGTLSTSPWAVNCFGEPLPAYIIGDLKKDYLSVLLKSRPNNE
jgi:hypothetical protein